MTDKEKLEKLKKLADTMYYAAQHLTNDASRLHKAMDEYHKFIINEYHNEEPTIPDIVDEHFYEMLGEEPVSENNTLRKASEEYLKVLSETPYNNTPITNAQTIVRELITFLDNPSKYNPNHIEEPVSEEFEKAGKQWLRPQLDKCFEPYGECKMMELTRFDGYAMLDAVEFGANWQKKQMMAKAVDGTFSFGELADGTPIDSIFVLNKEARSKYKVGEKVKLIIIKED